MSSPTKTSISNAPPDTAAVRELLAMMSSTLSTLGQTFDSLTTQSAKVATLGPQLDSAHQIHQLRRQMRAQEKKQDVRINEVKAMVKEALKEQVADLLKPQISNEVTDEIKVQVAQQVKAHLGEVLPTTLEEQAAESNQQLKDVRASLINSESRRSNAILRASNLDDQLAIILKPNGEESEHFPHDLKTLFSYDNDRAKALVKDFGLAASDSREKNLNKFMAHAGIQFHLIPVPLVDPNDPANALGISM